MDYRCPICGKVTPSATTAAEGRKQINAPFFPFCSERCRLLDLGSWLESRYVVPAEPDVDAEDDSEVSDSN